ncbi:MAG: UDP-N-acetylmuramoyl-tripeptide--D-alanyl-D-alanine ligase [Gammaproteobacteria bacterium]|uniref:UDP-N-acetylmuramoyl-tripeptide--D-alanyl-D-alanine ligase n=1 Tax=SAR86 cluster bacterium TaxID=2030880 RepID=A0A368C7A2_9GAMM|nr:MAG: UDP-N-acetylmuramoyl-tripeptide--D-alanyl-D-alanine ligase [SAR86 cluster bacterium]|tara:strand:+ start:9041 stop:10381 length:1341 start_codon:yes stop_codon:yes gene_type:complete
MKFISNSNDLSRFLEIPIAKNIPLRSISLDSRTIKKGALFFAIKGKNFNGNHFVDIAFNKGASIIIADDKKFLKTKNNRIIYVKNTIQALKKISENIIKSYDGKTIAITGSSGKTSTTNIVASTLKSSSQTLKNFNNEIGMPISLMNASKKSKNIVLEIGASKLKDIHYLSNIIKPHIGVITNIGKSHLEMLKNIEGVLKAKSELVSNIKRNGYLVVPNENMKNLNFWKNIRSDIQIITFGMDKSADFYPKKIKFNKNKMNFYIASTYMKEDLKITTSLNGEHNIKNILTSFAVNYCLGNTNNFFINVLKNDAIKEMRQIKSKWLRGSLLIDDTYNANPDSTRKSIDLLSMYKKRTILVLGDMLELGKYKKKYHKEIGEYAKNRGINILLGFGDLTKNTINSFGKGGLFFKQEEDLKRFLKENVTAKDVILIKGSRGMTMERFINV